MQQSAATGLNSGRGDVTVRERSSFISFSPMLLLNRHMKLLNMDKQDSGPDEHINAAAADSFMPK